MQVPHDPNIQNYIIWRTCFKI